MPDRFCIGLDLGQVSDYSALSLIHERPAIPAPAYDVPALHRWPLGTSYTAIIAESVRRVRQVVAREPGAAVHLIVDGTGVGRGVVDGLAEAMAGVNAELVAV